MSINIANGARNALSRRERMERKKKKNNSRPVYVTATVPSRSPPVSIKVVTMISSWPRAVYIDHSRNHCTYKNKFRSNNEHERKRTDNLFQWVRTVLPYRRCLIEASYSIMFVRARKLALNSTYDLLSVCRKKCSLYSSVNIHKWLFVLAALSKSILKLIIAHWNKFASSFIIALTRFVWIRF